MKGQLEKGGGNMNKRWTSVLLLIIVALGGCAQLASQAPKTQASTSQEKEKKTAVAEAQQMEERPVRDSGD